MREIRYQAASATIIGDRSLNQDRCELVESINSVMLCLADGMGGHPKGEVAAQIFTDTCANMFTEARKPIPEPFTFLSQILYRAHQRIVDYGKRQHPPIKPRTTAVIALIQDNTAYWVHAGDSRLYLFRNQSVLSRTRDHSYVELLRRQGSISAKECSTHPQRNYVTRCLGGNMLSVDFSHGEPTPLLPDDILLLCSDGLWGALDEPDLIRGVFSDLPLFDRIQRMVEQAGLNASPESDNVTALALHWIEGLPSLKPHHKTPQSDDTKDQEPDHEGTKLAKAVDALRKTIKSFKP